MGTHSCAKGVVILAQASGPDSWLNPLAPVGMNWFLCFISVSGSPLFFGCTVCMTNEVYILNQ